MVIYRYANVDFFSIYGRNKSFLSFFTLHLLHSCYFFFHLTSTYLAKMQYHETDLKKKIIL